MNQLTRARQSRPGHCGRAEVRGDSSCARPRDPGRRCSEAATGLHYPDVCPASSLLTADCRHCAECGTSHFTLILLATRLWPLTTPLSLSLGQHCTAASTEQRGGSYIMLVLKRRFNRHILFHHMKEETKIIILEKLGQVVESSK